MEEMRQRREQQQQEMQQRLEQQRQEQEQRFAEARQKIEEDRERQRQEAEERRQAAEERRQNEQVGECLSCKGKLTRAQTEQETCPHCGVKWDYEVDAFGHKRPIMKTTSTVAISPPRAGAPAASPRKVDPAVVARISRFIVIGVVAVGLLVVMAIVVVVGISIIAASGSKPKQKFY